jgi:hypothetical protein
MNAQELETLLMAKTICERERQRVRLDVLADECQRAIDGLDGVIERALRAQIKRSHEAKTK